MGSQVAAYYDPDKQSFFVVMTGMPELMQGALYSHELYHALQDQHFGLAKYLDQKGLREQYRDDAVLARQAVVEGEATYMMSLWLVKWQAHETPVRFQWPDFAKVRQLRDWELLDSSVLGEFSVRIIFKENGLASEAESVAAGWGGDRYAVFKRKDSDATLLLWRTSWDTETDAKEFLDAYQRLLPVKYADEPTATRVERKGRDVFIVEGGDKNDLGALLKVVKQASRKDS